MQYYSFYYKELNTNLILLEFLTMFHLKLYFFFYLAPRRDADTKMCSPDRSHISLKRIYNRKPGCFDMLLIKVGVF